MDAIFEIAALGVDAFLFGVCYKLYLNRSHSVQTLKEAHCFDIDNELQSKVKSNGGVIPYAAITGSVRAISTPLQSLCVSNLQGVIRERITKERKIKWSPMLRLWNTVEHDIQRTSNSVPFALYGSTGIFKTSVEVLDPLSAEELVLPTIYDDFTSHHDSVREAVVGWFCGEHTTGIHEIENMLVQKTILTGVGEIVIENNKLKIRPPVKGFTYFLTSLSLDSLIKKLDEEATFFKVLSVTMAMIGVFILSYISKRGYSALKLKLRVAKQQKLLDEARRLRRIADTSRISQFDENKRYPLCVVCLTNPIEMLILECGHACLCIDCSERVRDLCPVCRARIHRAVPAYLP